jgi:hypothetical protein
VKRFKSYLLGEFSKKIAPLRP